MTDIKRYKGAPGVFSKSNKTLAAETDGAVTRTFYVEYWWKPPGGKARRFSQRAGTTLEQAKALKALIDRWKKDPAWMPPGYRRRLERERGPRRSESRPLLTFEPVVEAFLEAHATQLSPPRAAGVAFSNLKLAFGTRSLDEVTPRDLRRYLDDRTRGSGPFRGQEPVKPGVARGELALLEAVFEHLRRCGFEVDNPFAVLGDEDERGR